MVLRHASCPGLASLMVVHAARWLGVVLGVVTLLSISPARVSAYPPEESPHGPSAAECQGVPPPALTARLPDPGSEYSFDVRILLDGVGIERGLELTRMAARAFAGIGVKLMFSFEQVTFEGVEVDDLLAQSRERFGGQRPPGIDMVHLITTKNALYRGTDTYAGGADCIGGVRYPEFGFSFSEDDPSVEQRAYAGFRYHPHWSAGIVAHELAHLLGAHHQDGNCLEGAAAHPDTPCTVMEPAIRVRGLYFGTLERLAIRAIAHEVARSP